MNAKLATMPMKEKPDPKKGFEEVPDTRKKLEEVLDPKNFPEEMPDPKKELEEGKVSIVPSPLVKFDDEEEEDESKRKYRIYVEDRLEFVGLPTVILPGKRNMDTLNKWVKKEMKNYKETWHGFLVYFDGEPANKGLVNGYVVRICDGSKQRSFEFGSHHYRVTTEKFPKIEGAKSPFDYIISNNGTDLQKFSDRTSKDIGKLLDDSNYKNYKNNKYK